MVAGTQIQPLAVRAALERGLQRDLADEHLVRRRCALAVLDAERGAGIALRIEVDHQNLQSLQRERGGDVDGGGRLADAALLVGDGEDSLALRARVVRSSQRCAAAAPPVPPPRRSGCRPPVGPSTRPPGRARRPMFHVKHRGWFVSRKHRGGTLGAAAPAGRPRFERSSSPPPVRRSVAGSDSADAPRRRSREDPRRPRNISSPSHRWPRGTPAHAGAHGPPLRHALP